MGTRAQSKNNILTVYRKDNPNMIEPIYSEKEWIPTWRSALPWQPPDESTMVVAPHPDDETLGIGGLIATQTSKGVPVQVVAVTDGENAYNDGVDIAASRAREQTVALGRLGVDPLQIHRLTLTDSGVSDEEELLVKLLKPLVSRKTHIFAPWTGDFHPDHEACGRAAAKVATRLGAALTFYFFWTWHRGTPELLRGLPLVSVALSTTAQQAKAQALALHRSQLEHASGQPILPDCLLWPARKPFEIFLPA